ncbi:MAG: hypothetical protein PHS51_13575 [Gallionella sp.]|nr:hypothetical protein [Gallionella sp.]
MRHTQGSWHNVANTEIRARFANQNGDHIATVCANGKSESAANARLIAAAPDLLEALIMAELFILGFEGDETQKGISKKLLQIRAAISKAAKGGRNVNP